TASPDASPLPMPSATRTPPPGAVGPCSRSRMCHHRPPAVGRGPARPRPVRPRGPHEPPPENRLAPPPRHSPFRTSTPGGRFTPVHLRPPITPPHRRTTPQPNTSGTARPPRPGSQRVRGTARPPGRAQPTLKPGPPFGGACCGDTWRSAGALVHREPTARRPTTRPTTAPAAKRIAGGGRPPADVGRRPLLWPGGGGLLGHVDEAAVVALERDGDGGGGAVAVLGDDQVGLTGARRLLLVGVLTVQQDHHVRILFD